MIKVNLLGEPDRSKEQIVRHLVAAGGVALIGIIAGIGARLWIGSQLEHLQAQRDAIARELAAVRTVVGQVRSTEKELATVQKQVATMGELERRRYAPVALLADIAHAIPNEVWLTELQEREGRVVLRGVAVGGETVATFNRQLSQIDTLSAVSVDQIRLSGNGDAKLHDFSISARMKVVKPALSLMKLDSQTIPSPQKVLRPR